MKWEYKIVVLDELVKKEMLVSADETRRKREQVLNQFGKDGWEAVSLDSYNLNTVLMKRECLLN